MYRERETRISIYTYIYTCIHIYIYTYIYTYIERETINRSIDKVDQVDRQSQGRIHHMAAVPLDTWEAKLPKTSSYYANV